MATIKDVAKRANVSTTTVSHVINKTRFVAEETRNAVWAAIKELHYSPSAVARSLKVNHTKSIGLLATSSEAGAEFGIKPVGLGARDTLRLEMGFCLYGNDLDDTTSPIEAGLGWITKFVEGKNFTNRPMLEKQKAEGTTRKLVGFEMIDRGIPRHGYELYSTDGIAIGVVTSGTMSPTRKIGIGMGYIRPEYSKVGTEICIDMRGRKLKAVVVKPPFRKQ